MAFSSSDIHINSGSVHSDDTIMLMNFNKDTNGNYDMLNKKLVNTAGICASGAAAANFITFDKTGSGSITLNKNTIVEGDLTSITASNLEIADNSIKICDGNTTSDVVDGTIFLEHKTGGVQYYSGIARDADDGGKWKIFKTQTEPTTSVNFSDPTLTYGDLNLKNLFCNDLQIENQMVQVIL